MHCFVNCCYILCGCETKELIHLDVFVRNIIHTKCFKSAKIVFLCLFCEKVSVFLFSCFVSSIFWFCLWPQLPSGSSQLRWRRQFFIFIFARVPTNPSFLYSVDIMLTAQWFYAQDTLHQEGRRDQKRS